MSRSFWALLAVLWLLFALAVFAPDVHRAKASDEVQAIACAPALRWDCGTVRAIIWRESRDDNTAVNPYSGAACWFQIMPMHGYNSAVLTSDPWACTMAAYRLWMSSGYEPWRMQ